MGKEAVKLGANTFAFFTRNPRGGAAKAIDPEDAKALNEFLKENNFGKLVAHAPYTMNVCAAKEDIKKFGMDMLKEDMKRMEIRNRKDTTVEITEAHIIIFSLVLMWARERMWQFL